MQQRLPCEASISAPRSYPNGYGQLSVLLAGEIFADYFRMVVIPANHLRLPARAVSRKHSPSARSMRASNWWTNCGYNVRPATGDIEELLRRQVGRASRKPVVLVQARTQFEFIDFSSSPRWRYPDGYVRIIRSVRWRDVC